MRKSALMMMMMLASASPAMAQTDGSDAQPTPTTAAQPQAQSGDLETRLAQLEARLNAVEQRAGGDHSRELDDIRQEIEDLRAEMQDQNDSIFQEIANRVTVSGYMHTWLRKGQDDPLTFRAFRANIILNAQVNSLMSFFAEWEFEDASAVGEGGGVVETERAYMQLALWQALGIRAGILLVPFGSFNLLHEGWRHPFSTRPVINRRVFPSTYADVGVELYGRLVDNEDLSLSYELMASNGLTNNIQTEMGGANGLRSARPSFGHDNNNGKAVTARLGLTAGEHVTAGLSGYYDPFEDGGTTALGMAGADLTLTYDSFVLRTEGLYIYLPNASRSFDDDGDPTTPDVTSRLIQATGGGVLELEYRFFPSFLADTPFGSFENPKFFLAFRGDAAFRKFPSVTQTEYAVTGSFGYRPVQRSAIRLEYLRSFAGPNGGLDRGDDWEFTLSFAMGY